MCITYALRIYTCTIKYQISNPDASFDYINIASRWITKVNIVERYIVSVGYNWFDSFIR